MLKLKRLRKIRKKERFLKNLVQVYASPWAKVRGTFRESDTVVRQRRAQRSIERFETDRLSILKQSLILLGMDSLVSEPPRQYFSILISGHPDETLEVVSRRIRELFPDAPLQGGKSWDSASLDLLRVVLDQLLEEDLVLHRYDYDYLDDVVALIESRYVGETGVANRELGWRFLRVLLYLAGQSHNASPGCLPELLKGKLGEGHPYVPKTAYRPEEYKDSHYHDYEYKLSELNQVKGAEDPEAFLQIWAKTFEHINRDATDKYEERDISLIYGYENNHHLLLRSIIGLKSEGKLTADDEVLVIGPRYADEILFFRNALGFPKTIGLDLRTEGDVMVAGDMHDILFSDRKFKLVYGANVFEYAYDLRKVVNEVARVLKRPGYFAGIFRSTRQVSKMLPRGCDVGTLEGATSLFYQYPHTILAQDPGLTPNPEDVGTFPSVLIRFDPE